MLVDPRLPIWSVDRNEPFSRRVNQRLGLTPPEAIYSLSRRLMRWSFPITTIVTGVGVLGIAFL
jgi:hypothetical protein